MAKGTSGCNGPDLAVLEHISFSADGGCPEAALWS